MEIKYLIPISAILIAMVDRATSISCYVCNTTSSLSAPFQCSEWFDRYDKSDIQPQDCSNVHDAKYCIKHIGRFEANSILCYQCNTSSSIGCSDGIISIPNSPLQPKPCDHVIDAEYCVKWIQLGGGIGAKRYCSSRDLGNYCDYVRNKGDGMEYRSCIFTCDSDGCNHSSHLKATIGMTVLLPVVILLQKYF